MVTAMEQLQNTFLRAQQNVKGKRTNLQSWTKVVETHENYQPFSLGVNSPLSPRER